MERSGIGAIRTKDNSKTGLTEAQEELSLGLIGRMDICPVDFRTDLMSQIEQSGKGEETLDN